VCWFGIIRKECRFGEIRKKAAMELVGNGMENKATGRHCTGVVDRLIAGSSSLSPFTSDMGE
jgi:hypothetical protein